jgi:hypothetical protein
MDATITLTKVTLVNLLDSVLYPNPDDPDNPGDPKGPLDPIGPIAGSSYNLWQFLSQILLNPQPLPPGRVPDPWRRIAWLLLNPQPLPPVAGPHPDPWRSALLARAVIDQAVAQYRYAETLSEAQAERAVEGIRSSIREFVDDYCGTHPPRWPRPWPWPPRMDSAQPRPIDLLVAGAQFQKAADFDNPLQTIFSFAADQLFETGLSRMGNRCHQRSHKGGDD